MSSICGLTWVFHVYFRLFFSYVYSVRGLFFLVLYVKFRAYFRLFSGSICKVWCLFNFFLFCVYMSVVIYMLCCVDWAGVKSDPFRVSNGIRQGVKCLYTTSAANFV